MLNKKKQWKIIILVVILAVISLSILGVSVLIGQPYYRLVFNGDSRKDFSQQYREFYDNTDFPLRAYRAISAIEDTPKERKGAEETLMKVINKVCPIWENCPFEVVSYYIGTMDMLDPSFNINEDEGLKSKIIELYTDFKQEIIASGRSFLLKDSSRQQMIMAQYAGLLGAEETEFWFKRIIEYISSSPHSINSGLMTLRLALDIHNINDLQNRAKKLRVDPFKIKRATGIICSNIDTPLLSSVNGSFLSNLSNKSNAGDLGQVWSYIARKDFCQIERTLQDQAIILLIIAKNYIEPVSFYGVRCIEYKGETIKYFLVNSDKIFSK